MFASLYFSPSHLVKRFSCWRPFCCTQLHRAKVSHVVLPGRLIAVLSRTLPLSGSPILWDRDSFFLLAFKSARVPSHASSFLYHTNLLLRTSNRTAIYLLQYTTLFFEIQILQTSHSNQFEDLHAKIPYRCRCAKLQIQFIPSRDQTPTISTSCA